MRHEDFDYGLFEIVNANYREVEKGKYVKSYKVINTKQYYADRVYYWILLFFAAVGLVITLYALIAGFCYVFNGIFDFFFGA